MRSIRSFLLSGIGIILLLSFAIIYGINHFLTEKEVDELYDAQLVQTSRIFEGFLDRPASEVDFDHINHALAGAAQQYSQRGIRKSIGHEYEHKFAIQLWDAERNLLIKSPSAPLYTISPFRNGYSHITFDNHEWRVYSHSINANGYWVIVGERDDVRGDMADNIEMAAIAGPLLAMLMLALGVMLVIKFALKPLGQVSEEINERHINRLEPICLEKLPRELTPLLSSINYLMSRLSSEVERERQFLGNVAHELRTPLAAIKLNAQLGMKTSTLPAAHLALQKVEKGINRSNHLVEQLLIMARLEPAALGDPELLNLRDLIVELVSYFEHQGLMTSSQVYVNWSARMQVVGYATLLSVMFRNLFENSIRYGSQSVQIHVTADQTVFDQLVIDIEDNGPGVSQSQLVSMGRRFFRENASDRQGTGLGLSIVARIVEIHKAQIQFSNCEAGGLQVKLIFPAL